MKISMAGDVNFSFSRGQAVNWMTCEKTYTFKELLFARMIRKINKQYKLYEKYPFTSIELPEYSDDGGGLWNFPFKQYEVKQNPFVDIKDFFLTSDVTFLNLESPFSSTGRHVGDFNSDPQLLPYLKDAGIDIVSVANNHAFDQGETGFEDTLQNLKKLNIEYVGGGFNMADARRERIITVENIRIGFLAYTNFCNHNFYGLARSDNAGILPLYYRIIKEDIEKLRAKADYVFVYLHYGLENVIKIHSEEIKIAHIVIDYGADIVLGGHSHVPKGVEIYKNKPILYSLGNFVFTCTIPQWGNNLVASIELNKNCLQKLEIFPILSNGENIINPKILVDEVGVNLLNQIKKYSQGKLNTELALSPQKSLEYIFHNA
jgi:poly-gamma-glutamate synthesis protein (capsule biosynthesis protein)